MNYNEWFHNYHRYLKGYRNGVGSYNDTKWNTINDRYKTLVDISSSLLNEQPYGVIGNYIGFQQLNDLIQNSSYTYDDVDSSFTDMYRMVLQNAMGNMLVNTHAVIAHYNQRDKKNVSHDRYGHYYIIDVPYDQLHFGERDEFVRQKLHEFYETENQYFMPADKFLSDEISSILGFTLICCTNGMMSDDWSVGIDEKGFRFKIGWKYSSDVDFIIYKLDDSKVFDFPDVAYENVVSQMEISYESLGIENPEFVGKNCIIQITDPLYRKDVQVVPNFGYFTESGLQLSNLQDKTVRDLQIWKSKTVKLRVYVIKYLNEIEGIFPAINYLEMVGTHYVYNDQYDHITNDSGSHVFTRETIVDSIENNICTPPISPAYDYNNTKNHAIIRDCYNVISTLQSSISSMSNIMKYTKSWKGSPLETETEYFDKRVIQPAKALYQSMLPAYESYLQGAIISSLIEKDYVTKFSMIIEQLNLLQSSEPRYKAIQSSLQTSVLYDDEYRPAVEQIIEPLKQPPFSTIGQISYPDYFTETKMAHQMMRPISEQCFITLKYNSDADMQCWVFDVPELKHFNGIENVFYIDENLQGDEVYKFLYLYTETEDPKVIHKNVYPLEYNQLIDFDLFSNQMRKYIGYVRYWNVSNMLAKVSKSLYQKYNDDTVISVLSRILKHKMDDDVLFEYPSNINYEISNITSDNVKGYTEYSSRAPFAINFMFYTLKMLFDQPDKLQSYFMDVLTRKEFHKRYTDLRLADIYEHTDHIAWYTDSLNYSIISYSPYRIYPTDADGSVELPVGDDIRLFSGINFPVIISEYTTQQGETHYQFDNVSTILNNGIRYPWAFNLYGGDISTIHPMITNNSIEPTYFMNFRSAISYGIPSTYSEYRRNTFYDDPQIAKMISVYLAEIYPGISDFFTDYKNIWNKTTLINSMMNTLKRNSKKINDYLTSRGEKIRYRNPLTEDVLIYFPEVVDDTNAFYDYLEIFKTRYMLLKYEPNGAITKSGTTNIFTITSKLLMMMEKIYEYTGFDRYAIRRIRKTYMHLKKINSPMSLYEYKNWINEIDINLLEHIPDYFSDNDNIAYTPDQFRTVVDQLETGIETITSGFENLDEVMVEFKDFCDDYFDTLKNYCNSVIQTNIMRFYKMNPITIPETIVNTKPAYAEIQINADDVHVDFGLIDDFKTNENVFELLLGIKYDEDVTNHQFHIYQVIPTCTYAFVSDEPMTITIHLYDDNSNEITTIDDVQLTFISVGTSADMSRTIYPYSNFYTIPFEVQNTHETFDINNFDQVTNVQHAGLNYELLCGNKFIPLDHTSEYCSPNKTELQGPIDKLYLSCEKMNELVSIDQTSRPQKSMFFQPVQVFHIEPESDVITSIGGKYFVGQRLYAITDDGLSLIPMIITAIDHSQERGMIEARVDLQKAKWFETTDVEVMEKYLTTDISCTIVDDNIRNFMDEFTEYDGPLYSIPDVTSTMNVNHEIAPQFITLPGDPYFVETNADYVYTRLSEMFPSNGVQENPSDPYHRFIYLGSSDVTESETFIMINMINHNFNPFTLPELYPVLRAEPDDLKILKEEKALFDGDAESALEKYEEMHSSSEYNALKKAVENAPDEQSRALAQIYLKAFEEEMDSYHELATWYLQHRRDMETPTTWYNVRAYDDALVYINNGRAKTFRSFSPHIQDISYNENLEIRLYDWEHRVWIDPEDYTIEKTVEDGVQIDPVNEYETDNVLTSIKITFNGLPFDSKRILIYLVYSSKDQFDIPVNDMNCTVRFRPVLSLKSALYDENENAYQPYDSVRIRKHFDANETYHAGVLKPLPAEFNDMTGIMFNRVERSGTYTDGSSLRFGNMFVTSNNQTYAYDDFDIYIPNPSKDTTMNQVTVTNNFDNVIIQNPDGFVEGYDITLIPVSNVDDIQFNGVASNVMFKGITNQYTITITSCTKLFQNNQTILCTVLPDKRYPISGGLIRVTVSKISNSESPIKNWIHLTGNDVPHLLIPRNVALVPKEITLSDDTTVLLTNRYDVNFDTDVSIDNTNLNDPYIYYYDTDKQVRYPISDIRKNQINKRLVIDRTLNETVNMIRSNYIGITRYISQHIPSDGIIDLTGKIPTPLSRDRYEIWVNGRYVNDTNHLTILSPTTFQLRNMISLKNLEVIELVDDLHDTVFTPSGPIYIDITGKVYTSYLDMIKHRANIMEESIQYYFEQNNHSEMDEYVPEPNRNPNNKDYEADILSYIIFDDTISSYNELHNIPRINGNDVYHMTSASIGFMELPNQKILEMFDQVWKREALEGIVPFGHSSMYYDSHMKNQSLHVRKNPEGGFDIYTTGLDDHTFTLYISDLEDGIIDDATHTKKIMPLLHPGVRIHIDDTFEDMWLHSTNPTTEHIQIK